jgi:hypothetical protein
VSKVESQANKITLQNDLEEDEEIKIKKERKTILY